jgi:hypothetical protein
VVRAIPPDRTRSDAVPNTLYRVAIRQTKRHGARKAITQHYVVLASSPAEAEALARAEDSTKPEEAVTVTPEDGRVVFAHSTWS